MEKNNFKKRWKTATCEDGAKCWCRLIVTEDYKKVKDDMGDCITYAGHINKKVAQYLVKLHNEELKREEKRKKQKLDYM